MRWAQALCLGLVALAVLALVVWNVRRVASRRRAEALPGDVIEAVLGELDRAGEGPLVLLRPSARGSSRLGGLARVAEWPKNLIHLAEIDGVALFASPDDGEVLAVRARGEPRPAPGGVKVLRERPLREVRLPGTYAPREVLEKVPAARALLEGRGDAPERLLPHVLMPGVGTHELDACLLVLKDAEPHLIQQAHEPRCPDCGAPQAFLFQVGDVLGPELELGDAAVVYVYGCATHRERLAAFVDSH